MFALSTSKIIGANKIMEVLKTTQAAPRENPYALHIPNLVLTTVE